MKNKLNSLASAAVLLLAGAAQGQSLTETQEWVTNTLQTYTVDDALTLDTGATKANGASYFSGAPGFYSTETTTMVFKGCSATITRNDHLHGHNEFADTPDKPAELPRHFDDFYIRYVETLNFSDINPESFKVDSKSPITLEFFTTNNRPKIACTTSGSERVPFAWGKSENCLPQLTPYEYIRLGSTEYARRLAKALRHITLLCGGKPSIF
jgi:hypothetical protein